MLGCSFLSVFLLALSCESCEPCNGEFQIWIDADTTGIEVDSIVNITDGAGEGFSNISDEDIYISNIHVNPERTSSLFLLETNMGVDTIELTYLFQEAYDDDCGYFFKLVQAEVMRSSVDSAQVSMHSQLGCSRLDLYYK